MAQGEFISTKLEKLLAGNSSHKPPFYQRSSTLVSKAWNMRLSHSALSCSSGMKSSSAIRVSFSESGEDFGEKKMSLSELLSLEGWPTREVEVEEGVEGDSGSSSPSGAGSSGTRTSDPDAPASVLSGNTMLPRKGFRRTRHDKNNRRRSDPRRSPSSIKKKERARAPREQATLSNRDSKSETPQRISNTKTYRSEAKERNASSLEKMLYRTMSNSIET